MKKILIILGHPDTSSLNGAIADSYEKSAKAAKHKVKRLNLGELKFDPILHHGYNQIQKPEPDLLQAQKYIKWSNHIVFIYPTWWGTMPAVMKGFIDRAILPGFAFNYTGPNTWRRHLKGRSARIITTMGGISVFYRLICSPGIKTLKYAFLLFCGISPNRVTIFGAIRKSTSSKRIEKILKKIKKMGARGK